MPTIGKLCCRNCTATFAFLQCGRRFYQKLCCNKRKTACNIEKAALQENGAFLPLAMCPWKVTLFCRMKDFAGKMYFSVGKCLFYRKTHVIAGCSGGLRIMNCGWSSDESLPPRNRQEYRNPQWIARSSPEFLEFTPRLSIFSHIPSKPWRVRSDARRGGGGGQKGAQANASERKQMQTNIHKRKHMQRPKRKQTQTTA